jgi:plasmid maintenance system antidote protein VapI
MSRTTEHVSKMLRERLPNAVHVRAMATALSVDPSTVYNYRSGARNLGPDEIVAICRYLRITADELLGLEECRVNWTAISREIAQSAQDAVVLAKAAGNLLVSLQAVQTAQVAQAEAEALSSRRGLPSAERTVRPRAAMSRRR